MKTVDVKAKEWFDKINGNSYFSARIIIDYTLPTEQTIYLPFQYGYDEMYKQRAIEELKTRKLLPEYTYLSELDIIFRWNKVTSKKREAVEFGNRVETAKNTVS